ncbi:uncharacterized protein VTP21DRAFT_6633 [Calcarisporiella thermophila]|uniref:uncharacterized protein n=1 Tax=Calcarisporiella thermophila TaxID=911321 RepID=UPI0037438019
MLRTPAFTFHRRHLPSHVISKHRLLWSVTVGRGSSLDDTLASTLKHQPPHIVSSPTLCLAFISSRFSPSELQDLPASFSRHLPPAKLTLGCIVDGIRGGDVAIVLGKLKNHDVTGFQISGEDRAMREVSVGRWFSKGDELSLRRNELDSVGWEGFKSASRRANEYILPPGLEALKKSGREPSHIFMLSAAEPYHFLDTLDHRFSQSIKFGVISARTPFLTGLPHTLIYNSSLHSTGTIGFALTPTSSSPSQSPTVIQVQHPCLVSMGDPMQITHCRGNIVLEVDHGRMPSRLLLDLLRSFDKPIDKNENYYLGIVSHNGQCREVYKVTSGDPAKGNLAVDAVRDLKEGEYVQFFRFDCSNTEQDVTSFAENVNDSMNTLSITIHNQCEEETVNMEKSNVELNPGTRTAMSIESAQGFILGQQLGKLEESWVCKVPESAGTVHISD